jgi:SAM-dependent methyltransferase
VVEGARPGQLVTDDDKRQAIEQWTNDPCGLADASGPEVGSLAFYQRVDRSRYEDYAPWMRSVLEFDRFAGRRVLEIGFGMGTDLAQFAAAGAHVAGIDLSPAHLGIAARRFALTGTAADLRLGDAEDLPFADGSFDAVYSFGVIHHTPDAARATAQIHRVLRPGGRLIVAVYHRWSAYFLCTLLLGQYLLGGGFLRESYRRALSRIEYRQNSEACPLVKLYSRRSLRRLFVFAGFRDVEVSCHQLHRTHFGGMQRWVPERAVGRLEDRLGWYLVVKAVR